MTDHVHVHNWSKETYSAGSTATARWVCSPFYVYGNDKGCGEVTYDDPYARTLVATGSNNYLTKDGTTVTVRLQFWSDGSVTWANKP